MNTRKITTEAAAQRLMHERGKPAALRTALAFTIQNAGRNDQEARFWQAVADSLGGAAPTAAQITEEAANEF